MWSRGYWDLFLYATELARYDILHTQDFAMPLSISCAVLWWDARPLSKWLISVSTYTTHRRLQVSGGWAETRAMLVLENSWMVSTGAGMLGHLQSEGIYEDIEVDPVPKKEENTVSRLLMLEEGYDDAEEPEDQPTENDE